MGWCPGGDIGHRQEQGQVIIMTGEKTETRPERQGGQ